MENQVVVDTLKLDPASITPDHVRGLSLGRVTEEFGTAGLYVRTIDSLARRGFGENELVQKSLHLGLTLHADDYRTNGHYTDHLMRATLHLVEDFGIRDQNIIAAGPLHDTFEDHPIDLVRLLTHQDPANREKALKIARGALASYTNPTVARIVWAVTNPPLQEGENKVEAYTRHTEELVKTDPEAREVKRADFLDNAGGNHATIGDKQRKLDEKYIRQFRIHRMGMFMADTIIDGRHWLQAQHMLSTAQARMESRLWQQARESTEQ